MSVKDNFKKNLRRLQEAAGKPEYPNLDGWSPKHKPQPVALGSPNLPPVPMKDPIQHAYTHSAAEVNKIIKSYAPIENQVDARTGKKIDLKKQDLPPSHEKRSTQEVNKTIKAPAPIKGQINAGTGKEIPVVKESFEQFLRNKRLKG